LHRAASEAPRLDLVSRAAKKLRGRCEIFGLARSRRNTGLTVLPVAFFFT
jgi:hypothetical protein